MELGAGLDYHVTDTLLRRSKRVIAEIMAWEDILRKSNSFYLDNCHDLPNFGGLLWPIAWLWAYSKPVLHKMAYGTDVDDSHETPGGEKSATSELEQLRARVAELEAQIRGNA